MFTPPVEAKRRSRPSGSKIPQRGTLLNEIRPKKYLSPGIPAVPLWQNSCNLSYAIPLGLAPWNLYLARNVNTNGHIELECFNLLKPDGTVPLGICHSKKRFSKSSTNADQILRHAGIDDVKSL